MSYDVNKTALVDSGFWYALLDQRDQHFEEAQQKAEKLLSLRYVIPWPILYESLCTRFVSRPLVMRKFEAFLKRPNAVYLDDHKYKHEALERTLSMSGRGRSSLSLVDNVLRMIIDDVNVRVNCIFTFNRRDFVDVCVPRNVELI
jgi:predicted nucleic acid-binding protein